MLRLPPEGRHRIWFTVFAMHWRSGRFAMLLVAGAVVMIFIVLLVNR